MPRGFVLFCTLCLIAAVSWGVGRYSRRGSRREPYADAPADTPDESPRVASGQA